MNTGSTYFILIYNTFPFKLFIGFKNDKVFCGWAVLRGASVAARPLCVLNGPGLQFSGPALHIQGASLDKTLFSKFFISAKS